MLKDSLSIPSLPLVWWWASCDAKARRAKGKRITESWWKSERVYGYYLCILKDKRMGGSEKEVNGREGKYFKILWRWERDKEHERTKKQCFKEY